MRRLLPPACLGILLCTTSLTPIYSAVADDTPAVSLDTVTVYATRTPQSSFDVPVMTSNIETDAPGNALAGDTGDLLEFTPGVEVANGPRRNGQTVSIRGFDNEAIITLIDGRRQNFEAAHDGRFFVDPSLLKRVEIVKGASSAIYGGGAIGGVLAFDTKDAADMLQPGQDFGVYTSMGYRTANEEYSPVISAYGRTGALDIIGIAALRNSGNIRQGDGSELIAEDNLLSGTFKIGYSLNDFNSVKFIYQGLNNDGQEPNNGGGAITASNPVVDKKVTDNQFGLKYEFEDPGNSWLKPKLHLYYNTTNVREEDISGTNLGRVQIRDMDTIGFTADNQTVASVSESQKHTFSYGFEIYHDEQTGTITGGGTRPGVPNADATNYGFYLQDEIDVMTSAGRFLIIPAARFDSYRSSDDAGNSQSEHKVSPKISMSYLPTENIMFFSSLAQAFRAPNLTELYASGQHFPAVPPFFPANFFIPNPDLRPETVTTFEIGAGINFDDVIADKDEMSVKGSWFISEGNDFITQDVNIFAGTTEYVNIPNARLSGFEVDARYQLHPVTAKLGLSYVEAENRDTAEYLSNNLPLTFVADLSYNATALDSIFGLRGRFAAANDKVSSSQVATPGYSVYDLYYRWIPSEKGLETLTVDLGVSNVLDKAYTTAYAGLLEEGRSYNVRVAYKW
ncbi:TonB-dependent hemoglobin/transferrin/lactoferrin family receptor [Sneathiella chungangensis]|uniref:TonB-dependent hemoglobin/transferrin/lactoferrin family receptor n=1 Tax=Sneathiella chungangensis TaxID=1418234 RepID=A0A845MG91_9PROT|nr:TonB-dependent hemoglobin/transferrin/lactoferrin family receptor [Sneathiella chungangensis]MZR22849.1 TonB-dependent hemoglobin/transferrin/lactoferrin family receptor [Sneathiella chungangensis]